MAAEDLTGKVYGRLTVISREANDKSGNVRWLCQCVCGKQKIVHGNNLRAGRTTSCGCSKRQYDIIGKRFGQLVVIADSGEKDGKGAVKYLCKCDCGEEKKYITTELRSGRVKSCGCERDKRIVQGFDEYKVDGVFVPLLTQKKRTDNKSGVKGVHFLKSRGVWGAEIKVKEKRLRKTFANKEDAIAQRKEWEEEYHKPYIDKMEEKGNDN